RSWSGHVRQCWCWALSSGMDSHKKARPLLAQLHGLIRKGMEPSCVLQPQYGLDWFRCIISGAAFAWTLLSEPEHGAG
nr:hypothetical protein [Tanacetum cinerariifolium]